MTYGIMTKRNISNNISHDASLALILADSSFIPLLKSVKTTQTESIQFNEMRQTIKNSKKKQGMVGSLQRSLICCGGQDKISPQGKTVQVVEPQANNRKSKREKPSDDMPGRK